jgi:hypothetical protein
VDLPSWGGILIFEINYGPVTVSSPTMPLDPTKFLSSLEKHVGINDTIYGLNQHSKALTDPKTYYSDYLAKLALAKKKMAVYVVDLVKIANTSQSSNSYTDEWLMQVAGADAKNKYRAKLVQV